MSILTLENVVRRREKGGAAFELVIDRLALEAGRFYAVVGASGSGKSTLLDLLALVLRPTSAGRFEIAADGRPVDLWRLWQRADERALAAIRRGNFGYVLQTGGLVGFLTVMQNQELAFDLAGRPVDRGRVEAMAAKLGIAAELRKKPRHLSGGQRQRAAILRALVCEPAIVLADEPTAAVDFDNARTIVREFRARAKEAGATIVMVSHDASLVKLVADEIIYMESAAGPDGVPRGRIVSVAANTPGLPQ
jgi:putative ABC transport system ATP-binding protein